jgi:hypothetical protein
VKRVLIFAFALFLIIPFQSASASTQVIISEPTHRLMNGKFLNDSLAAKLMPSGPLGFLVYKNTNIPHTWLVDPATIEEITAMSNGYGIIDGSTPTGQQVAKDWLTRFYRITKFEKVSAITYGNPSKTWISKLMPEDVEYLDAISKIKLEEYLGKAAPAVVTTSSKQQKIANSIQNTFSFADKQFKLMSTLVDIKEFDPLKLRMAHCINIQRESVIMLYLLQRGQEGLAGSAMGGPMGGIAGSAAGSFAGDQINKKIGIGLHPGQGRYPKGSPEAKEHMARLRAMRRQR